MPSALKGGQKALSLLLKLTQSATKTNVSVGYFPQDHYPDGTPLAQIASVQEYGTTTIPARPFLRSTIANRQTAWAQQARQLLQNPDTSPQKALTTLGQTIVTDIQTTIDHITTPPLKPTTISHKTQHHSPQPQKPLIDTGLLRSSLRSQLTQE
ncbi:hypothetical protein [Bombella pollinis]|uniref:Uncharacterized protein n=1 Tax=Bombella pollinis TaxID=2967337 RepID=A0ABT3WP00_9PROT|nr:hypothetical protein [Bombella pollinis]MCX5619472.1 hypothetical protein [Bombella pollinis]